MEIVGVVGIFVEAGQECIPLVFADTYLYFRYYALIPDISYAGVACRTCDRFWFGLRLRFGLRLFCIIISGLSGTHYRIFAACNQYGRGADKGKYSKSHFYKIVSPANILLFSCSKISRMDQKHEKAVTPERLDQTTSATRSEITANMTPTRAKAHQQRLLK